MPLENMLSSFDPVALLIASFFGLIGFAAWRYGRKQQSTRHVVIAIMLMSYGMVVTSTLWVSVIGVGLTVLLFWP